MECESTVQIHRMLPGLEYFNYEERLESLGLLSVEQGGLRG